MSAPRIVVLVPTYQNAGTIAAVLDGVRAEELDLLVVDDGCTDGTRELLAARDDLVAVRHEANRGKGAALRTGFARARELDYSHAISIDSDGQHDPAQLPAFVTAITAEPEAIVIGARDMNTANVPARSRFGLRCSNFGMRVLTGLTLPDTQSGFRAYPLKGVGRLRLGGNRFELEVEVLIRGARSGIPIRSVPIPVHYAAGAERVTHFRPVRDFLRVLWLELCLLIDRRDVHVMESEE